MYADIIYQDLGKSRKQPVMCALWLTELSILGVAAI